MPSPLLSGFPELRFMFTFLLALQDSLASCCLICPTRRGLNGQYVKRAPLRGVGMDIKLRVKESN